MQQSIQAKSAKLNLLDGYKKVVAHIQIAHQKHQTRKQLAKLPDYLLEDVNLDRDDVQREINKSFFIMK